MSAADAVPYSRLDRLLHRVAFAAPFVQLTAADIEGALWAGTYARARADRPVFITSLPRAGTTVLLEVLAGLPSFASHCYRDMPFVMAPVLWAHLSGPFQRAAAPRARAHGDGLDISFDSPEAFEEVLWRTFWPDKYGRDGIARWTARDVNREAEAFFREHMRKIVALRRPGRMERARYLSKNNGNIARMEIIGRMFPDATLIVPLRHPLAHARSLQRQHLRFLELHRAAPFVERYMADIGHYEFGTLHRPIRFEGLERWVAQRDPRTLDYWLAYWIAAFEARPAPAARTVLVSYEALCADPGRTMTALCEALDVEATEVTAAHLAQIREAGAHGEAPGGCDEALREHAEHLHASLRASAVPAG